MSILVPFCIEKNRACVYNKAINTLEVIIDVRIY